MFDTLIDKLTEEEILAVVAHEIGHSNLKHVWIDLIVFLVKVMLHFVVFYLLVMNNSVIYLITDQPFIVAVISFLILMSPVNIVLKTISNSISRMHEYEADLCSKDFQLGNDMINALRVVARENLGNLTPHPLFVKVYYNHPPISLRIENIESN